MNVSERGVVYEFALSASNNVDFGDVVVQTIRTPDGSEFSCQLSFLANKLSDST